jgi:oxygen-independent coproporphyrinogen-3 oxidase
MRPELLRRYAAPVPRYTSYPTAPHFSPNVDQTTYSGWLESLEDGLPLSLYVHIPFCNEMCWYCGCSTKVTRQYSPIARYLKALSREIETVSGHMKSRHRVSHIHWGGGSPSILPADDIRALAAQLKARFMLAENAEFAVEIDPRGLDEARIAAFAEANVNRVSIGVQDFAEEVQKAINRIQSVELTAWVVDTFREHGIDGINIDLVYGLPFQTLETLDQTIDHILALAPDRIALFGYAHLPQRIKHQRLIDESGLPDTEERFRQANRAAERLKGAGYVTVGLDHYARPHDPLARGTVRRNFQGYTTDTADALIGLGASSIGRLPQGYVQNTPVIGEYERRVIGGGLGTARGHAMSEEDAARSLVIERLMCDFAFPADELRARFGDVAELIIQEANALLDAVDEEMIAPCEAGDGFEVTDKGRIFVRSICAKFDAYLGKGSVQHSAGV